LELQFQIQQQKLTLLHAVTVCQDTSHATAISGYHIHKIDQQNIKQKREEASNREWYRLKALHSFWKNAEDQNFNCGSEKTVAEAMFAKIDYSRERTKLDPILLPRAQSSGWNFSKVKIP